MVLLVAWLGLAGILIAAGEGVTHSPAVAAWDGHVTEWMVAHRSPPLNTFMKAVTWLGTWIALAAAAIFVFVLTALRRLPVLAVVLAVVAWGGEAAGVTLAKNVARRQRPPERLWLMTAHGWSWPSGHAAAATLVFTVLAIVATYLVRNPALRLLVWVGAVLAVAAVGLSRIELGVHWTTDVIGSIVFVGLWIGAIAVAVALQARHLGGPVSSRREATADR
jgi:undecaprenyl-diphosphatase